MSDGASASKRDLTKFSSFITDLDPPTIEALIRTAARSQAPALRDLFYKYLTHKASIGVSIPVSIGRSNGRVLSQLLILISGITDSRVLCLYSRFQYSILCVKSK